MKFKEDGQGSDERVNCIEAFFCFGDWIAILTLGDRKLDYFLLFNTAAAVLSGILFALKMNVGNSQKKKPGNNVFRE